tara:strand:+ start:137 stop:829 length:693 start_codon:yes stop_codon:yes gene_type:complete
MIPKIIHQTWKDRDIPNKWTAFVNQVQELNPDWEYRLWTDDDIDVFVEKEYPDFYDTFNSFSKVIMKADVIRYLIMYKIGGVYLDLDYEVLQPFDFNVQQLVLPLNRSLSFGDHRNELGNCFFASVPGHKFWKDVINDLKNNPPDVTDYSQIVEATGPKFLSRIYFNGLYENVYLPDRLIYHPPSPNNKRQIHKIKTNGVSLGIHHHWGSWKERWTIVYFKAKLKKWFKF